MVIVVLIIEHGCIEPTPNDRCLTVKRAIHNPSNTVNPIYYLTDSPHWQFAVFSFSPQIETPRVNRCTSFFDWSYLINFPVSQIARLMINHVITDY